MKRECNRTLDKKTPGHSVEGVAHVSLFRQKKSVNSSHDNRPMHTDRQSAQQPPRKEILQIAEEMIKKHHADLEYLKDK